MLRSLVAATLSVGVAAPAASQSPDESSDTSTSGLVAQSATAAAFGISGPVRLMRPEPRYGPPRIHGVENPFITGKPPIRRVDLSVPARPDGALQTHYPMSEMPAPLVSFEGISNQANFPDFWLPPDTQGDVGPNHYVQVVNNGFAVWSKTGAVLAPHTRISALFSGLPPGNACRTIDDGDPIVLYDPLADRWLISQFAWRGQAPAHECVAISTTPDPTGAWFAYDFVMPNLKINDYPKFAVWPDAYYMTDNQFSQGFTQFLGVGVFAFDRARMLAGDPGATFVYFDLQAALPEAGGMLPADLDGLAPPPGTPNYFAFFTADEFFDPQGDGIRLFAFVPDFASPGSSTFSELPFVAVAPFDPRSQPGPGDIDQPPPGSPAGLDAIGDRLMFRLAYRNFTTHESLVVNHTVEVDPGPAYQAGIRYYELRRPLPGGNFAIQEQGTFAPDSDSRWMGAAQDRLGNLGLGYSVSSLTTFPSIRYAGRLADDIPGGLFQGEASLQAGSYSQTFGARWGDYSGLSVDPTDDCTFWYTQEYYSETQPCVPAIGACWQTRIGSFRFPHCTTGPTGTLSGTVTDAGAGMPLAGAIVATSAGLQRLTGPAGTYALTLPTGTYDLTVSKFGYATAIQNGVVIASGATTTRDFALAAVPVLAFQSAIVDDSSGNDNGRVDRNECAALAVTLRNTSPTAATGVSAVLTSSTPGVTVTSGSSTYPDIAGGGATGANDPPFRISTAPSFVLGTTLEFSLAITTNEGVFTVPFAIPTGYAFQATGPIPIFDLQNNVLPVQVSGVIGALPGAVLTIHITHAIVADLDISLFAPDGTNIDLTSDNGANGSDFGTGCPADAGDTTFDDDAAVSIVTIVPSQAPFVGSFRPEQPLSTFSGLSGSAVNGTWRLQVFDDVPGAVGYIQCLTLRLFTDADGGGQCRTVTIGDVSTIEGDFGASNAVFPVMLDSPSSSAVTVAYATANGIATAGVDYAAASGTLTFAPGSVARAVTVSVLGDLTDERDETYFVNLSAPAGGGFFGDNQGLGTIVDDDAATSIDSTGELAHGFRLQGDLASAGGVPDSDTYRISQQAYSSYEVVVDAASGDVVPIALERLDASSAVIQTSTPVGSGPARSLRWANDTTNTIDDQTVRVRSGGCTTNCGAEDGYRLRAYETTYAIPRFNNAGTQVTVLVLQNPTDYDVSTSVYFWSTAGALLHAQGQTIAARNTFVFNTSTVPALQGSSGTATVTHNGRHGDLAGKTVALEPASGYSFDSPMVPRPR